MKTGEGKGVESLSWISRGGTRPLMIRLSKKDREWLKRHGIHMAAQFRHDSRMLQILWMMSEGHPELKQILNRAEKTAQDL